jgi:hypothetical protein
LWTFPLRLKSDTFSTLTTFFAYVLTQFGITIQGIQCDNDREFDNLHARTFFSSHGIHLRMSCPYTSTQNGKTERIIRSINNVVCSLLFHASVPPNFWAAALSTATYLLINNVVCSLLFHTSVPPPFWAAALGTATDLQNILPTKTLTHSTPHFYLFGAHPSYEHLRVFGCTCYPNLSATAPHKISPRSTLCFPRVSPHHKGYLCLDRQTNRMIISCHVVFDEASSFFRGLFPSHARCP